MYIAEMIWFGFMNRKTIIVDPYRGPLSISLELVEEDEVYLKLSVLGSYEFTKRRKTWN